MIKLFSIPLICLFFSCKLYASQNDYEFICNAFKEPINSSDLDIPTREEKLVQINEKIWANIKSKEAKSIMSVVASASPDKKYTLFKEAVELITGRKWDCPAMRDF